MKKRKNVLIIDDDQKFLEEMQETLRLSGYDSIGVLDSREALDKAIKVKPDIILLDLKMETMSGFQVAINLRQSPDTAHIPIIAITGYFTNSHHLPLLQACGVKTCLIKPIKPLDIIARIEAMVNEK